MGGIVSYLWSWVSPGPTFDLTPDPVTGLTEKDCHWIMSTWELVADRHSIKKNGVELFIQLFKAYPYIQEIFPLFRGRPLEELRTCPKMKAHGTSVMYAIKSYVGTVDDAETLAGLVTKMASTHVPRGVTKEDFDRMAEVYLAFMKSVLGTQWTPDANSAWKQLFTVHNALYKQVETESTGKQ